MKPRDYARWIADNILRQSEKSKMDGKKEKEKTEQETEEQENGGQD